MNKLTRYSRLFLVIFINAVPALAALWILPFATWAVPAPESESKPFEIKSGGYVQTWGASPYILVLHKSGEYQSWDGWRTDPDEEIIWSGSWSWNSGTRTLAVSEHQGSSENWLHWKVVLDVEGRGTIRGRNQFDTFTASTVLIPSAVKEKVR